MHHVSIPTNVSAVQPGHAYDEDMPTVLLMFTNERVVRLQWNKGLRAFFLLKSRDA